MDFEIFKVGTHTSDKGESRSYTSDDLNFIADSYAPEFDEAPIVIGHPVDNSPAYGWISSLKVTDDGKLVASALDEKIHPEFLSSVKEGRYKKRSISLTPEGKLRHVGFLGAAAPAIKGLKDIQFSQPSSFTYEFSLDESADSQNQTNDINPDQKDSSPPQDGSHSEKTSISSLYSELDLLKKSISSLSQNFSEKWEPLFGNESEYKNHLNDIDSQLNSIRSKISVNEFESLLNSKISDGSLTPGIKNKLIAFSNFMECQNFSENFAPDKFRNDINQLFIELVNSFPKIIYYENFSEKPDENSDIVVDDYDGLPVDENSKSVHKKALKIMGDKNISYIAAVKQVLNN